MKLVLAATLVGLVATFPFSAAASEAEVGALVARKAAIVKALHDKATLAIVQVAQDPAFPSYFDAAHLGHQAHAHEAKVRIDHISLATQEKFHVEEMCLIDINGAEVSRIVRNQIAYDLSLEEADNAFFAPSFERKARSTYIAPLYVSPDVSRWVMAYTTPIEVDGKNVAILHYEHGLDVYQTALNKDPVPAGTYVLAVDSHNFIVSDSRSAIAIEKVGGSEDPADYFSQFGLGGMSIETLKASYDTTKPFTVTADGNSYVVGLRDIADWTIVVVQEAS